MSSLACQASCGIFDGLKSYSRTEVELTNRFTDLFRTDASWGLWVEEGLGALLETAGERVMVIEQSSQIEPGDHQTLRFQKEEISIGRGPDNDIVLALAGVGRRHARIVKQETRCVLEDLGSANGTFLNDEKIEAHKPVVLQEGAQILIFPYQFTFSNEQTWSRQGRIQVASSAPRAIEWDKRLSHEYLGTRLFSVQILPHIGPAVLRISQELLQTIVSGISRAEATSLVPGDEGLFEFVLLSVLERANRQLRFPFHFSLIPFQAPLDGESGISIESTIEANGARGNIEIFLSARLLEEMRARRDASKDIQVPVWWPVLERVSYADLSLQELAELEAGDVLLVTAAHCLLLPPSKQGGERGWRVESASSDRRRLKVEDYFERIDLAMDTQADASEQNDSLKPNLSALPVRVHVVLSQLDMSLSELSRLRPGSIVELDREKSEPVQLAVNGRIAGTGELVEIEGRLGVRISSWTSQ